MRSSRTFPADHQSQLWFAKKKPALQLCSGHPEICHTSRCGGMRSTAAPGSTGPSAPALGCRRSQPHQPR
eukprot:scaffold37676_cov21-Tisochrysis_lutea.AAC.1